VALIIELIDMSRTGPPNPTFGWIRRLEGIGVNLCEGSSPRRHDIKFAVWFLESARSPDAKGRSAAGGETISADCEHIAVLGHALKYIEENSGDKRVVESIRNGLADYLEKPFDKPGRAWANLIDDMKTLIGYYFRIDW